MPDPFAIYIAHLLKEIAAWLHTWVVPLNSMGYQLSMNIDTYQSTYGATIGNQTMSTIAFNSSAGPWIASLGDFTCQLSVFVADWASFLKALGSLLS